MSYNGHKNYETWAVGMFMDGNYDAEKRISDAWDEIEVAV